jgi:hypothetical protein
MLGAQVQALPCIGAREIAVPSRLDSAPIWDTTHFNLIHIAPQQK